jgi:predicted permease
VRDRLRRPPFWFLRRRHADISADIDEEIDTHLAMRVDALVAAGWTESDARQEAVRQFGDRDRLKRSCSQEDRMNVRQVQRHLRFNDIVQDTKICVRSLLRARTLTATILLTVGLGIGLTSAMFAAVRGVLLRPLPYADPARLVRIYSENPSNHFPFSVADYLTLTREQTQFEQVAGYVNRSMIFSESGGSELVQGSLVSSTYFDLLGIQPAIGRGFTNADADRRSPPAAIVSHAFWAERLSGRTDALGTPLRLDGADYTLVGVLPRTLGPLEHGRDVFVAAQWTTPPRKGPFFIQVLGRVRHDADLPRAAAELRVINARMFPVWKASFQDDRASWALVDLKTDLVGDSKTLAGVAVAAVSLLWLIACANASSLLLARVTSRRRELAVRAALGATRARLVRLLLAEGALLAAGSAVIGLSVAWFAIRLLRELGSAYVPRTEEIVLDGPVLLVCVALTAMSAILCSLIPALQAAGGRALDQSLRSSTRSATATTRARTGRRVMVATQFAIATPLLIAAVLLLMSLHRLERVDLGFDTTNLVTAAIRLPSTQYTDRARRDAFWTAINERAGGLAGVSAFALADGRPPRDVDDFNNFDLEKFPTPPGRSQPVTPWIAVTPDYFRTLGVSLLEGRLLEERDSLPTSPDVVVVDRAWARRFFPGQSAVGQRLKGGGCSSCDWTTVVGVVSDVKYAGLDKPNEGSVYMTLTSTGWWSRYILLRTTAAPSVVLPQLRDLVRQVDPSVAVADPATMDDLVASSLEVPRSLSWLIATLAGAALLLSTIGIYGVMSHYVQEHARDMSIRLALGGTAGMVARQVLRHGMLIVGTGIGAGIVVTFLSTRFMAALLFGVGAADPTAFAAVAALLMALALIACAVPSRRAVRVDPASVLRSD